MTATFLRSSCSETSKGARLLHWGVPYRLQGQKYLPPVATGTGQTLVLLNFKVLCNGVNLVSS